jgi:hypothetical protein
MLFVVIITQYAVTLAMMNIFDMDFLTLDNKPYIWIIVLPGFLVMSFTVLNSLFYLDKHVIDQLVELEMDKRDTEYETYSDEVNIHQHEVFRDLQMIKILAQEKKYEDIKDYIS